MPIFQILIFFLILDKLKYNKFSLKWELNGLRKGWDVWKKGGEELEKEND